MEQKQQPTKKNIRAVKYSIIALYLSLNPLFIAMVVIYFDNVPFGDVEKLLLGIYAISWYTYGMWAFLYPIFKRWMVWLRKMNTPYNKKRIDDEVQKVWDDYRKEKKKECGKL